MAKSEAAGGTVGEATVCKGSKVISGGGDHHNGHFGLRVQVVWSSVELSNVFLTQKLED